ncbi:hypothetical protein ABPG77_004833 [Micractinium sp. CCAP 211/92]
MRATAQPWLCTVALLLLAGALCTIDASRIPDGRFVDRASGTDVTSPRRSLLLKGGTDTAAGRHPYFVSVRDFSPLTSFSTLGPSWPDSVNSASMPHACGGFLLNTLALPSGPAVSLYQFVITSASCVRYMASPVVIISTDKSDTSFGPYRRPCWPEPAAGPCPVNPDTGIAPRWPQVRTTYATYYHELWNNVTGSEYDVALLILDSQALPNAAGNCVTCVGLQTSRVGDGVSLTAIGMGSKYKQQAVASTNLQSIKVKTTSLTSCNTDRAAPGGNYFAKVWGFLNSVRPATANQVCTVPDTSAQPNGICRLDDGGPLLALGAGPAADQVVGIAAPPTETCNSAKDPSVYTDASKTINWVQRVVRAATPILGVGGFQAPNITATNAVAGLGIRTVYGYSMKIQYVNRTSGANAACTNDDTGVSLINVAGPNAVVWSKTFLQKGFWDPIGRAPVKSINGEYNPFQVNIVSCSNGALKLEWSSSKNFTQMKQQLDGALLPANDANWNTGARFWARYLRCDANVGSPATNPLAIRSFEISTGKGSWKRYLAGAAPNTAQAVYNVDLTGYPTDCDGALELEDGSIAPLQDPPFVDPSSTVGCVQTPTEYLAAFEARQTRCVSPNLFSRLTSGDNVAAAKAGLGLDQRLAYFWSGSDVLAKYARIGYPQTIGYSTISTPVGLDDNANGLALTEQVGYPAAYSNVAKVWVLNVFTRAALQEAADTFKATLGAAPPYKVGVGPFSATWDGWKAYYEYVWSNLAGGAFRLPDAAINVLKNTDFKALTGCAAECAYSVDQFPTPVNTSPLVTQPRNPAPNADCPAPAAGTTPIQATALVYDGGPAGTVPVAGGGTASYRNASELCNADWKTAFNQWAPFYAERGCGQAKNVAAGQKLRDLVNAAPNARMQAMYFRAFLTFFCAGTSNSLFSGDGYTYTGFGGTLSPLGTEFITSPLTVGAATLNDNTKMVQIPFCISGTNGGRPNAGGTCDLPANPVTRREARSPSPPLPPPPPKP